MAVVKQILHSLQN